MVVCYIGIGSNLGKRDENIKLALYYLEKNGKVKIEKISSVIETDAVLPKGTKPQGKFLNAAIKIKTSLSVEDLLLVLKDIEKKVGRKPAPRFSPRVIDLDILLYGNKKVNQKDLKIPHPRMFEREFVMKPLKQLIGSPVGQLKKEWDKNLRKNNSVIVIFFYLFLYFFYKY